MSFLDDVTAAARLTAADQQGRGVECPEAADYEDLLRFRDSGRRRLDLDPDLDHVDLWRWRPESGGPATTEDGLRRGIELRIEYVSTPRRHL
jgi:hypothetical protein